MMPKIVTLAILMKSLVFSQELYIDGCAVDYSLMYSLAENERHGKREIGYPYLISFNVKNDAKAMRNEMKGEWLDWRTIDCKSESQCVENLHVLINKKVFNVDLGGYQFNYKWFKFPPEVYFSVRESYSKACERLVQIYEQYGWTWDAIAIYHNTKDEFRIPYAKRLAVNYQKNQLGGK